jgi:aryl-alcohol dehydrogenase-like predicted oxidoreductase
VEQRQVGRSGLLVSRLGLGTLTWGRDTDEHEAADQLKEFLDAGGTLLDTGTTYGGGAAEDLVGSLVGTPGSRVASRDDVVVCTKGGDPFRTGRPDVSRRGLLAGLDASLRRLGTDHVDIWLTPAWSETVPLAETLDALDHAVTTGRARYAGLSNFSGWQTAAATVGRSGPGRGVVAEVEYSLVQRGIESEVLPAARALGLGVLAWSPLGRGVLTGKYRSGIPADSRAASPHLSAFVQPYLDAGSRRIVDAVVTAADGLGCAPADVALAWARDQPGVTAVLLGARSAAQLRALLGSEAVSLPAEITEALDEVSGPSGR